MTIPKYFYLGEDNMGNTTVINPIKFHDKQQLSKDKKVLKLSLDLKIFELNLSLKFKNKQQGGK